MSDSCAIDSASGYSCEIIFNILMILFSGVILEEPRAFYWYMILPTGETPFCYLVYFGYNAFYLHIYRYNSLA
jgi:hypothetical protein